ncbi:reverse transcriptase/maturase family protein [Mucilaginibacter ximonensis]|uniref:Reverse transcriptase/maturase family protein n=1 Tax=Mucilaginibacter ximonensis TaxID=538021 RepID=A0ABW5YC13_9SPHI
MPNYEGYFSAKAIIKILCKYRLKQAKTIHKYHLLRDISLHPKSLLLLESKKKTDLNLEDLFPPRRTWVRPNLVSRKKIDNTHNIRIQSLYKTIITTHLNVQQKELIPPQWYLNLQRFIEKIQRQAKDPDSQHLNRPVIKPIKKENSPACKICRPISIYTLEDRILISFTARYLTDKFDPHLHNCSYAFRSSRIAELKNHHHTIEQILKYRKQRSKQSIYVAEADLEKFFDAINHRVIKSALEKFALKVTNSGSTIDDRAIKIFHQYLASYTFNKDVFVKNDTDYFIPFKIPNGRFEWPIEQLKKLYTDINDENIGVPQGGALSCLIANMVLHDVDEEVDGSPKDNELLYLRFCDDMILLHTDESLCTAALNRYEQKVSSLNLLMHKPEFILQYGEGFWKKKSKRPYHWARASLDKRNVPWLGFVGYQIRFDGAIRVRKKSIKKEALKQKAEVKEVLKALNISDKTKHEINENSRKSKRQQTYALKNRLISMSVGRVKLHNYRTAKNGLCWTNGFQCLTMNPVSKSQCRFLDRNRYKKLRYFKKRLSHLIKETENKDDNLKPIFFGHPFSYHGFLK